MGEKQPDGFLVDLDLSSITPLPIWVICGKTMETDLVLGARCMVASKEICKTNQDGQITNYNQCAEILSSGKWVVNERSSSIRFDQPR
jgi:hypothetical protein